MGIGKWGEEILLLKRVVVWYCHKLLMNLIHGWHGLIYLTPLIFVYRHMFFLCNSYMIVRLLSLRVKMHFFSFIIQKFFVKCDQIWSPFYFQFKDPNYFLLWKIWLLLHDFSLIVKFLFFLFLFKKKKLFSCFVRF